MAEIRRIYSQISRRKLHSTSWPIIRPVWGAGEYYNDVNGVQLAAITHFCAFLAQKSHTLVAFLVIF